MKHTPGPWDGTHGVVKVQGQLPTFPIFAHFKGGGDPLIAICYDGVPYKEEGMEANARLIAAAPELLGSLKWAMHHVENVFALTNPEDPEFPELLKARAAIAKAEGTPPDRAPGGEKG